MANKFIYKAFITECIAKACEELPPPDLAAKQPQWEACPLASMAASAKGITR